MYNRNSGMQFGSGKDASQGASELGTYLVLLARFL